MMEVQKLKSTKQYWTTYYEIIKSLFTPSILKNIWFIYFLSTLVKSRKQICEQNSFWIIG